MRLLLNLVPTNGFYLCQTLMHSRSFVSRATKLKAVEKRLGLPEKPKRVATAYNRFFKESYHTLKELKNKKPAVVASEISALWNKCDETKKQEYEKAYKKDLIEYREKLDAYKCQITDAQLSMLKLERLGLEEKENLKKIRKAKLEEQAKPKRPVTSFIVFSRELRQTTSKKWNLTEIAAKYNGMSDAERKMYYEKAREDSERYRQELQTWKEKK